jgi:hypothetical protein
MSQLRKIHVLGTPGTLAVADNFVGMALVPRRADAHAVSMCHVLNLSGDNDARNTIPKGLLT